MKSVIRYFLSVFYLLMLVFTLSGQNKFANEWINSSKKYYKIKVAENGIYKVTYEEALRSISNCVSEYKKELQVLPVTLQFSTKMTSVKKILILEKEIRN